MGAMRQPLLCSSSRHWSLVTGHCHGREQEARKQPQEPRHRVTSAGAGAALLPGSSMLSSHPKVASFCALPMSHIYKLPWRKDSMCQLILFQSECPAGHWFWPQSLSTFPGDEDFMSFSTERTGSSVFPLASLAHTAIYYTHSPVSPSRDEFPDFPGQPQEMEDSSFSLSMILPPAFQLSHSNQARLMTMWQSPLNSFWKTI